MEFLGNGNAENLKTTAEKLYYGTLSPETKLGKNLLDSHLSHVPIDKNRYHVVKRLGKNSVVDVETAEFLFETTHEIRHENGVFYCATETGSSCYIVPENVQFDFQKDFKFRRSEYGNFVECVAIDEIILIDLSNCQQTSFDIIKPAKPGLIENNFLYAKPVGNDVEIYCSLSGNRILTDSKFNHYSVIGNMLLVYSINKVPQLNGVDRIESYNVSGYKIIRKQSAGLAASTIAEECAICFTEILKKTKALVPCGHSNFCENCLTDKTPVSVCPVCKSDVTQTMKLY